MTALVDATLPVIAGLYAGIAALFLVFLSVRVIRLRVRERVSLGHGDNPAVERAVRAHANFAEYVPLALLMLALVEAQGADPLAVHALGAGLLAARLVHFASLRGDATPGPLRVAGMAGTFTVLIVLAGMLIARFAG
jgi:uncharacterized membrane protein YecN with MAPEG domain